MKVFEKIVNFVKESYEELKKAQWPSREKTIRLTISLIVISAGMGLFVSAFDYIFKELLILLVGR